MSTHLINHAAPNINDSTTGNSLKLSSSDPLIAVSSTTSISKPPHLQLPTNPSLLNATTSIGVKLIDPPDSPEFRTEATVLSGDGQSQLGRGAEESWNAVLDSFERSRGPAPLINGPATIGSSSSSLRSPPLPNVPSPFGGTGRSKSSAFLDGNSLSVTEITLANPDAADQTTTVRRDSSSSINSNGTLTNDLNSSLPPGLGRYEEERLRVVKRFGLDGASRREAIDRCAAIAQAYFRTPTVIISLVLENKQILASEIGWEGDRDEEGNLRELPINLDVLQRLDTDDCYVMLDARQDWRLNEVNVSFSPLFFFRSRNYSNCFLNSQPYEREGGRLSFFASAPIHLPTLVRLLFESINFRNNIENFLSITNSRNKSNILFPHSFPNFRFL